MIVVLLELLRILILSWLAVPDTVHVLQVFRVHRVIPRMFNPTIFMNLSRSVFDRQLLLSKLLHHMLLLLLIFESNNVLAQDSDLLAFFKILDISLLNLTGGLLSSFFLVLLRSYSIGCLWIVSSFPLPSIFRRYGGSTLLGFFCE